MAANRHNSLILLQNSLQLRHAASQNAQLLLVARADLLLEAFLCIDDHLRGNLRLPRSLPPARRRPYWTHVVAQAGCVWLWWVAGAALRSRWTAGSSWPIARWNGWSLRSRAFAFPAAAALDSAARAAGREGRFAIAFGRENESEWERRWRKLYFACLLELARDLLLFLVETLICLFYTQSSTSDSVWRRRTWARFYRWHTKSGFTSSNCFLWSRILSRSM